MPGTPNFTGAFVGMACQDMAGTPPPPISTGFPIASAHFCPILSQLPKASQKRSKAAKNHGGF